MTSCKKEESRKTAMAEAQQFEQAIPGLVHHFNDNEKTVFKESIDSVALHTQYVKSHDEGYKDIFYLKPMSVHFTIGMKEVFQKRPEIFPLEWLHN